jgi:AcrR family transcriptional regulator
MDLADREGLAAITVRRLAADLDASPMALYRYVDTKDDVLELLVDAAYAEMTLPQHPSGS